MIQEMARYECSENKKESRRCRDSCARMLNLADVPDPHAVLVGAEALVVIQRDFVTASLAGSFSEGRDTDWRAYVRQKSIFDDPRAKHACVHIRTGDVARMNQDDRSLARLQI